MKHFYLLLAGLSVFLGFILPQKSYTEVFDRKDLNTVLAEPLKTDFAPYDKADYIYPNVANITDEHLKWMFDAGIQESDIFYVEFIMSHESTWRLDAVNYLGCIGIGQNCPDANGYKWLEEACPDWRTNAVCQLKRFAIYAQRYGGWEGSYLFWINNNWW